MTQSSAGDGRNDAVGGTAASVGLTGAEALRLLRELGPNALAETKPTPIWLRLVHQFQNPLIYVLLFALAFDVGSWMLEGAVGDQSKRWPSPLYCF